jgi:alginate O-acetyltransferase complex protein AlgI
MGQFFRDYIYIPLGGNRNNSTRNIFIVWCLTGLWHGASWNFVVWGLYFGTLLYIEKQFLLKRLEVAPALLRHSYALFFILIGWAIFYFTDFHRLFQFLKVLFFVGEHDLIGYDVSATMTENIFWLAAALLLCLPVAPWIHASTERMLGKRSGQVLQLACSVIFLGVSVILLVGQSYNPFIYFRF